MFSWVWILALRVPISDFVRDVTGEKTAKMSEGHGKEWRRERERAGAYTEVRKNEIKEKWGRNNDMGV